MARPKNKSDVPMARERILSAFWELLEDDDYDDITVSMICEKAGCYRGTFYYHFDSIDDLQDKAIEETLFGDKDFLRTTIQLALGSSDFERMATTEVRKTSYHLALLYLHGDRRKVETKIEHKVLKLWREILCEPGEDLAPSSKAMINSMSSFSLSGLTEVVKFQSHPEEETEPVFELPFYQFIRDMVMSLLDRVCEIEGIALDEGRRRMDRSLQDLEDSEDSEGSYGSDAGASAGQN